MRILVGNTGLVGSNLSKQMHFDKTFNSKNIDKFDKYVDDGATLYLSCLPATKWLINQSDISKRKDYENCEKLINIFSKKKYDRLVLISTIDVYLGSDQGLDEDAKLIPSEMSYGENRLHFEKAISNELDYNSLNIYRLPALFGQGLKKNILFDLINKNNLDKINTNSYYQWYNLNRLSSDINNINLIDNDVVNLFTEPVYTKDLLDKYFLNQEIGYHSEEPIVYEYKTKFFESGYIDSAKNVIKEIGEYLNENRN